MALKKKGRFYYGEAQADIRTEVARYSKVNGYLAEQFADAKCKCGGIVFRLKLDDNEGAAVRTCVACEKELPIGDSDEYLDEAELEECDCRCEADKFELTVGVSLYKGTKDVRWLYVGARCTACGLTGVYGDWKNEFLDYKKLLKRV